MNASRAAALREELCALQRADGAFPAEVELAEGGQTIVDHNVFVTALVVRGMLRITDREAGDALRACRERALDYLGAARSPDGASNHWPASEQPAWVPRLPDDADDTALVTRVLVAHGRLAREDAVELVMRTIVPNRLPADERRMPAWTSRGGYRTWLVAAAHPGVLDAAVNANVIGTLCALGLRGAPGFRQACELVRAAVDVARAAPTRQRTTVTPFYPALQELDLAIADARAAGARELAGILPLAATSDAQSTAPWIARAAYGHPKWRSRAVGIARALAPR
jgi:hypothetical protein